MQGKPSLHLGRNNPTVISKFSAYKAVKRWKSSSQARGSTEPTTMSRAIRHAPRATAYMYDPVNGRRNKGIYGNARNAIDGSGMMVEEQKGRHDAEHRS